MARFPILCAIAIAVSGCSSVPAHAPFDPGPVPLFFEWPDNAALWFATPPETREAIVADDLACQRYIDQVEKRAAEHNRLFD